MVFCNFSYLCWSFYPHKTRFVFETASKPYLKTPLNFNRISISIFIGFQNILIEIFYNSFLIIVKNNETLQNSLYQFSSHPKKIITGIFSAFKRLQSKLNENYFIVSEWAYFILVQQMRRNGVKVEGKKHENFNHTQQESFIEQQ